MGEQFSIIGAKEKHMIDFGEFNNVNRSRKPSHNSLDLDGLLLQNQTNLGTGAL